MTSTIWKFPLKITDRQFISVPTDSEILSVGVQYNTICLWVAVHPTQTDKESICIDIFGTGHPVDDKDKRKFIGTAIMNGDSLVWHVFENTSQYNPL